MSEFDNKLKEVEVWLQSFKEGVDCYATIKNQYDDYLMYKGLLNNIPNGDTNLKNSIELKLIQPLNLLVTAMGPPLEVKSSDLQYSGATASYSTVEVLNEVRAYTPSDVNWHKSFTTEIYTAVQANQERNNSIKFISDTLHYLYEDLGKEFDEMIAILRGYEGSVANASSLGIKMRNVLEHFRGILHKCAMIDKFGVAKKDDTSLSWNKISEVVAINGKNSKYCNLFEKTSATYTEVHDSLSQDAKDYTVEDVKKLPDTFIKIINYLETSIKTININKVKSSLLTK